MRVIILILFFFSNNLFAQDTLYEFSFVDTIFKKGDLLVIDAVDFTNDINKYYFDEQKMDSLASLLIKNSGLKIEIVCNEDYSEMPMLSMMATTEQAVEIRRYLVRKGVRGTQVEIYGNGDMNLLVTENDMVYMDVSGKQRAINKNRRIEVTVLSYEPTIVKPKKISKGIQSYPK